MSDTWTIGELAERAALALRAGSDGAPAANGRVRDVPGERLIRWYTTIGLVDPPLTRRGRIAQYGRRHLLQLVAVKRLQAAGHSIAQIQTALAGATDRMLETAAGLAPVSEAAPNTAPGIPETVPGTPWMPDAVSGAPRTARPEDTGAAERRAPERGATERDAAEHGTTGAGDDTTQSAARGDVRARGDAAPGAAEAARHRQGGERGDRESTRGRFWAERPGKGSVRAPEAAGQLPETAGAPRSGPSAPGGAPSTLLAGPPDAPASTGLAGVPEGGPGGAPEGGPEVRGGAVVVGVRLGGGVRLVLDAGRVPSEEDVQAVLAAAGPLLAVLEERKLI
ncbi:MerR family transcriptional regulator [Nonomuraea sp. NPDC050451]|uniref:helix-turn-helix domain-containing protein n=1 Tax=Nonomuraea sp. NPDC050451 TaxID=3364364 RepID=UPI0037AD007B